jgi:hypothetical protein
MTKAFIACNDKLHVSLHVGLANSPLITLMIYQISLKTILSSILYSLQMIINVEVAAYPCRLQNTESCTF